MTQRPVSEGVEIRASEMGGRQPARELFESRRADEGAVRFNLVVDALEGGRTQTLASFTQSGIPLGLALLVIVTEFLGPLGLAVGLLSRVVALGFICEMLVAMIRVHWRHGFFMNWTGTQQGEGFEYHVLVIGMALTLLIVGAGAWSIDRALAGRPPRGSVAKLLFREY